MCLPHTGLDSLEGIESDFPFKAKQIAEYWEVCVLWKEIDYCFLGQSNLLT